MLILLIFLMLARHYLSAKYLIVTTATKIGNCRKWNTAQRSILWAFVVHSNDLKCSMLLFSPQATVLHNVSHDVGVRREEVISELSGYC